MLHNHIALCTQSGHTQTDHTHSAGTQTQVHCNFLWDQQVAIYLSIYLYLHRLHIQYIVQVQYNIY